MRPAASPVKVNPDYVLAGSYVTLAERQNRFAMTDEAIAKGAKTGPDAIWPDPAIKLSMRQTPDQEHWTRHGLRMSDEVRAATRAAILALPPHAAPKPPPVFSHPGQGQGGLGVHSFG